MWSLVQTDEAPLTFEHPDRVRSVAFGPGSRFITSGSEGGMIRIWDLETREPVRTFAGHSGPVLSVAIDSDGQVLISGGSDGKIKTWNSQTGEPLEILRAHPGGVASIALSPDGRSLASGGHDGAVKIWSKQEPQTPGAKDEKPAALSAPPSGSRHERALAPGLPQSLPE